MSAWLAPALRAAIIHRRALMLQAAHRSRRLQQRVQLTPDRPKG